MHSSEQVEVALVAYLTRCLLTPYFWPEGVVGGEGGCSTRGSGTEVHVQGGQSPQNRPEPPGEGGRQDKEERRRGAYTELTW